MKHCTDRLITVGSETQLRRSNTILSCSNDCLISILAAANWKHCATHFSGCVTLICLGHEKISRQTEFLVLFWSCSWASHKLTAQPRKIIRSLTRWFQLIEGKIMENSQFSKQEDNYFDPQEKTTSLTAECSRRFLFPKLAFSLNLTDSKSIVSFSHLDYCSSNQDVAALRRVNTLERCNLKSLNWQLYRHAKETGDKVILENRWKIDKINHKASTAQTTAKRRLN